VKEFNRMKEAFHKDLQQLHGPQLQNCYLYRFNYVASPHPLIWRKKELKLFIVER
jgi:hypothetical protein